jgi:hypothetical protein
MGRLGPTVTLYVDGVTDYQAAAPDGATANIQNNAVFRFGTSVCVGSDGTVPLQGVLDEVSLYSRALCPAEAQAIHNAGSAGKYSTNSVLPNMFVSVDGSATNLIINNSSNWLAFTNTFIASSGQTTVEFTGNSALSMLLDDIQLLQVPTTNYNNYFMPEESLSSLTGEDPAGCWTLDVWDTRNDSVASDSTMLLSWTLDMTFSSTNVNLIVLTNHVPYTNSAPLPANTFFAFDVPTNATDVTNTLSDTPPGAVPLSLIFNQSALPADDSTGDFTLITTPGTPFTLSQTGRPPPLVPGQRYFLGVQNTGALRQSFALRVDTDVVPTNEVTVLSNGVAVTTNITANSGAQYYSFDVPSNAVLASFEVLNATNGEVDLYARRGLPVPGPLNFDYKSVTLSSTNQPIVVTTNSSWTTNSAPVPLQPGLWYLSAYNSAEQRTLNYRIIASYLTDTNAILIIPLTNAMAFTNIAAPGYPTNIFYSFTNQPHAAGVRFVLTNLTVAGNIDLVVGLGALPTPSQSYSGSYNLGTTPERVQIGTNSALPSLVRTWYLAVPNDWTNKIRYVIAAYSLSTPPVTNYPAITHSAVMPGYGFTISWLSIPGATYEVDYSTNLVDWTEATQFTATNRLSSYTDPSPIASQRARYYRLSQLPSE